MPRPSINNISRSLIDLVGAPYIQAVCNARTYLTGGDVKSLWNLSEQKLEFFPASFQKRQDELVDQVGALVCEPLIGSAVGAGTRSFEKAANTQSAPLSGFGFIRLGEDGRAHLISKSEHYHASLGHSFPGYELVENARRLGIPNATHNNTRGHISRLLEQELIRTANGIAREDRSGLERIINSSERHVLNRVLNLETGSLAVEAGLKMMLSRFFRLEDTFPSPKYAGKTPVILVMADHQGGKKANYHGTTILTQLLRGMWPELYDRVEAEKIFVVKAVSLNDLAHFKNLVDQYDQGSYKVAGFFHEIVMMNYGGILLQKLFLQQAYAICHERDIPVLVDEIQSCIWSPELFLFREYGLNPDFVTIGKGFPGGEYPASRILTTAEMDTLNQFGALVTNGQEELASLAYLVTMEFVQSNREYVVALGDYYNSQLCNLAKRYPDIISDIEGYRHLSSIFFFDVNKSLAFVQILNQAGIDISAQTYKANCPPVALTKIPLISSYKMVDFLINQMDLALRELTV